jgi:alpha-glucosidase
VSNPSAVQKSWWKEVVVYQVYLRSFMDSNGDGIGDIRGLISKLDYLKDLGIDVIWISPMYKSPQDDNGYDISDYQDIHGEFGSMRDFDQLLTEIHARGMKLIIDLVINHTSDEHAWFVESRQSKDSPKRDWYIWRDPKNNREPNNWESIFGGSAWKFDDATKQYFMHVFSERQPDLNWENLEMRESVYKMIHWWMDKGIDGFRLDAISHMRKEPGLVDMPNPNNLPYVSSFDKHMNVPGILDYVYDLCEKTFNKRNVFTVGEANGVSSADVGQWVGDGRLNMLIQFEYLSLWSSDPQNRIDLPKLKDVFTRWQAALEHQGWNALFVENHDITRVVSKWGDTEKFWRESATAIAAMYFLMQGAPFIYQGQEIGMTNTVFNGFEDFNDVSAKNYFKKRRAENASDAVITKELATTSRDNARTPMQWSTASQAGFTTGKPWLKVNPNYPQINVEAQDQDPHSVLNFYRRLTRLRRASPVFVYGHFELQLREHAQVLAYTRDDGTSRGLVISNLTGRSASCDISEAHMNGANLVLGNMKNLAQTKAETKLELAPYETRVYLR